jgi:hypothetical protein
MNAKPISIKRTGGKSGGCALKAVELTSGDLRHVRKSSPELTLLAPAPVEDRWGNAGAASDGTLNSAGSTRGASVGSAEASGAQLNRAGGSAGLDHDSQGTFGARRANPGSSTAGSGMLNTRGGNAPRKR